MNNELYLSKTIQFIYIQDIESPIGTLGAVVHDDRLVFLQFKDAVHYERDLKKCKQLLRKELVNKPHPLFAALQQQLNEYFAGNRQSFDIPIEFVGSPFQRRVWECLADVPFGNTFSYTEQAERCGQPTAVRAVSSAVALNKVLILVPCHRIISSDGNTGGYSGGTNRKQYLLQLEGAHTESDQLLQMW